MQHGSQGDVPQAFQAEALEELVGEVQREGAIEMSDHVYEGLTVHRRDRLQCPLVRESGHGVVQFNSPATSAMGVLDVGLSAELAADSC